MTLKDYNIIIRDSLDFALQEYNLTWMQPVPFSINSAHFSLFKPELYLLFNVITVLMASVYLRKFFHPSDVTVVVYFKTITMLCTTSIYIFHNLFIINSSIIFNFALVIDYYTTVAKLLILISSVIILISSHKHVFSSYTDTVEYSIVVSFSIFFLLILISGYSMITVYMSLEGLSLMLYVLAAFPFNRSSLEAAIKYFIVGSFSSGLILFGIICMYGTTGTFDFLWLKVILETQGLVGLTTFRWLGLCSLLFGFLFKLGAFPCHMWAIDVYEGTWLPVTAFFMVVIKLGIFFFFIRFFFYIFYIYWVAWQPILLISAVGSLVVGCIGSIGQNSLKRLMAYATMSQVGFSFMALSIGTVEGIQVGLVGFFFYLLSSTGLLIMLLNTKSFRKGSNLVTVNDLTKFNGNVVLRLCISIILLSMAGIPPLAGFYGKYLIIKLLVSSSFYLLAILCIIIGAINSFAYIRCIKSLMFDELILPVKFKDFIIIPGKDKLVEDKTRDDWFFFIHPNIHKIIIQGYYRANPWNFHKINSNLYTYSEWHNRFYSYFIFSVIIYGFYQHLIIVLVCPLWCIPSMMSFAHYLAESAIMIHTYH